MKVYVIMGNDFPDAVFASVEAAERHIAQKKAEHKIEDWRQPRIYWRSYEFELKNEAATV